MSTDDLHAGFSAPQHDRNAQLVEFLHSNDQMPAIRAIQRRMRDAMGLRPGMTVVDAGCGIGLETERLAVDHPEVTVVGLDHNPQLLNQASCRVDLPNLSWHPTDLNAPAGAVAADVVRTERVLMYQDDLAGAVDRLLQLLRPDGRLVCYELDYGGILLDATPVGRAGIVHLEHLMRSSVPQPYAGRELPALLAERALTVTAHPFSFAMTRPIWQRIVGNTLRAHDADDPVVEQWLAHHSRYEAPMPAAVTGVLTVATGKAST